jgi:hypothetical protein
MNLLGTLSTLRFVEPASSLRFQNFLVLNSFAKGLGLDRIAVLNSCNQMTDIVYIWRQLNCAVLFLENRWGLLGMSTVFLR